MYNVTQLQNSLTITDFITFANDSSGGFLVGLFMWALFFIFIFVLKRDNFENALLGASFICFIISLFLTFAKLLNFLFPLAFATIMALTGLYLYLNRD